MAERDLTITIILNDTRQKKRTLRSNSPQQAERVKSILLDDHREGEC